MMAARIRTTPMVILHSFGLQTNLTLTCPMACGLTALAIQALPAEKFIGSGKFWNSAGMKAGAVNPLGREQRVLASGSEFLAQNFVCLLRIGLSLSGLHDLPDEKAKNFFVA